MLLSIFFKKKSFNHYKYCFFLISNLIKKSCLSNSKTFRFIKKKSNILKNGQKLRKKNFEISNVKINSKAIKQNYAIIKGIEM